MKMSLFIMKNQLVSNSFNCTVDCVYLNNCSANLNSKLDKNQYIQLVKQTLIVNINEVREFLFSKNPLSTEW